MGAGNTRTRKNKDDDDDDNKLVEAGKNGTRKNKDEPKKEEIIVELKKVEKKEEIKIEKKEEPRSVRLSLGVTTITLWGKEKEENNSSFINYISSKFRLHKFHFLAIGSLNYAGILYFYLKRKNRILNRN